MKQEPWSLTGRLRQATTFCLTLLGLAFLIIYGSKALAQIDDRNVVTGERKKVAITPHDQLAVSGFTITTGFTAVDYASTPEPVSSPSPTDKTPPASPRARGVFVEKEDTVEARPAHAGNQQQEARAARYSK